jgi:hypothetical protein
MKISDLAMLPQDPVGQLRGQQPEGGRDAAGTTISQSMLLRSASQNFGSREHLDVVGETDEGATRAVGQRQAQRLEHRIGEIEAQREHRGKQEQPGPDLVGAVDVAPGIRAAGGNRTLSRNWLEK